MALIAYFTCFCRVECNWWKIGTKNEFEAEKWRKMQGMTGVGCNADVVTNLPLAKNNNSIKSYIGTCVDAGLLAFLGREQFFVQFSSQLWDTMFCNRLELYIGVM